MGGFDDPVEVKDEWVKIDEPPYHALDVWKDGKWDCSASLRLHRDLLLETYVDPIASNSLRLADMSEEDVQALKDFRVALLDIPNQTDFPDNVSWPEFPSFIKVDGDIHGR